MHSLLQKRIGGGFFPSPVISFGLCCSVYFLLNPKTRAAHPSPARIPRNGAGVVAGVSVGVTGFTEGVSTAPGVGVCVRVTFGSAGMSLVSQTEDPCEELLEPLLFLTGVS